MIKIFSKKLSFLIVFAILSVIFVPSASNAISRENIQDSRTVGTQQRLDEIKERRETIKTKLEDKKLASCQKRERSINNIMARVGDRNSKQIDVFTKIYERVKTFYTKKGYILSNYDLLVADVDNAKADAELASAKVTDMSGDFKCDSIDPKGDSMIFKEYQDNLREALKTYKTAVKDLINGVKSVQSKTGEQ